MDLIVSFEDKDKKNALSVVQDGFKELEKLPIPLWAVFTIGGVILLLLLACVCCLCCRFSPCSKCCRKKKDDGDSQFQEKVDLDHLQLLGASRFERQHPSHDELDYSALGKNEQDEQSGIQLGRVQFGLEYSFEEQNLAVTIYEARDLPSADEEGTSDPYIRVMLLPDTKRRYETTVIDKTLNPVYNQTFVFKGLAYSEAANRTLCIQALDFDQFAGHDLLGEAKLPLIDVNLAHPVEREWRILVPGFEAATGEFRKAVSEYGDICISLRYVPVTQKLFVYVLECKSLKATDAGGVSDPYVRVTLIQNGKKIKRRKTRVKKQTTDPYYNEEFQFNIPPDKIEKSAVQFLVMDYDLIGKADIIGQVTVGANTYGPQLRQWRDMLQFPRKPIAQWHMLRSKPKPGEED